MTREPGSEPRPSLLRFLRRHGTALLDQLGRLPAALVRRPRILSALRRSFRRRVELPQFGLAALTPDAALELVAALRRETPELIVEMGSGSSTVLAAQVLRELGRGRLVALEHDAHYARRTRRELGRRGLDRWAEVREAPLERVAVNGVAWWWYRAACLPPGPVDFVIADGPPGTVGDLARYPALPLLAGRLRPGALIFVDDAHRDDERRMVARWRREYPQVEAELRDTVRGTALLRFAAPGRKAVPDGAAVADHALTTPSPERKTPRVSTINAALSDTSS